MKATAEENLETPLMRIKYVRFPSVYCLVLPRDCRTEPYRRLGWVGARRLGSSLLPRSSFCLPNTVFHCVHRFRPRDTISLRCASESICPSSSNLADAYPLWCERTISLWNPCIQESTFIMKPVLCGDDAGFLAGAQSGRSLWWCERHDGCL